MMQPGVACSSGEHRLVRTFGAATLEVVDESSVQRADA